MTVLKIYFGGEKHGIFQFVDIPFMLIIFKKRGKAIYFFRQQALINKDVFRLLTKKTCMLTNANNFREMGPK